MLYVWQIVENVILEVTMQNAVKGIWLFCYIITQLDLQYLHPHAAIDSSIGLNPSPLLELSATIGSKELVLGGEVGFDTASASFIKYTAGIGLNKPDFSAALLL